MPGLGSQSPNQREGLSAISSISGNNEYVYSTDHALDVNITGSVVTGDVNLTEVGGATISLGQKTSANSLPITIASDQTSIPVSQSGTWNINNISGTISLPTGAATSALQSTGNTSLSSIDSKTPALGQALAAGSVPVVLTASQLSTLTPLSTVAVTQSGTWSTRTLDGSGNSIGSTGGALNVNISSGNITGFATSANQTNGTQLTQIVDAGGDAVTVTGGKLDVNATISGSGGGTSSIDNSTFTAGSDTGTPAMGFYQSTISTVTDGDVAVISMTNKRGLHTNLRNASGTEIGVAAAPLQVSLANTASNSTAVKVDGTGGTFPVSGTVAVTQSTSPWIVAGGGTAGTAASGVVTVQGISSMTPVQVSQATASNLNATVVQGTASNLKTQATGAGTAGSADTGVLTVQGIGSMTPLLVTPAANSAINLAQVNGATVNVGTGAAGTGTQRVTTSTDSTIGTVTSVTQNADVRQATASNLNATVVGTGTFAVQTTPTAPTTIYNGKKTVTTAGTRVTLASSQAVKSVAIKALSTNTGFIYVGDGSVASTTGLQLLAGETVTLDIANLATVNLDSSVNGEGVTYIATN